MFIAHPIFLRFFPLNTLIEESLFLDPHDPCSEVYLLRLKICCSQMRCDDPEKKNHISCQQVEVIIGLRITLTALILMKCNRTQNHPQFPTLCSAFFPHQVETISAISKPFEAPHSYKAKPLCNPPSFASSIRVSPKMGDNKVQAWKPESLELERAPSKIPSALETSAGNRPTIDQTLTPEFWFRYQWPRNR
ncbi:hypothetical protein PVK06_011070 [Gossypium arboreum]|uniref:Uncharacterized protein n=1 Tax=Gossypium arboreum TaxID=29729 RepID=A0ABR0Q8L0_GOSAR|nr:hypothetical protein PVK06_011070 [Gossypium arboreum]